MLQELGYKQVKSVLATDKNSQELMYTKQTRCRNILKYGEEGKTMQKMLRKLGLDKAKALQAMARHDKFCRLVVRLKPFNKSCKKACNNASFTIFVAKPWPKYKPFSN